MRSSSKLRTEVCSKFVTIPRGRYRVSSLRGCLYSTLFDRHVKEISVVPTMRAYKYRVEVYQLVVVEYSRDLLIWALA